MDQELNPKAQESLDALRSLRDAVRVLKKEYTCADIESFVKRTYGVDERIVVCPTANGNCSQPSVPSA
jgi:hypothetical protein